MSDLIRLIITDYVDCCFVCQHCKEHKCELLNQDVYNKMDPYTEVHSNCSLPSVHKATVDSWNKLGEGR